MISVNTTYSMKLPWRWPALCCPRGTGTPIEGLSLFSSSTFAVDPDPGRELFVKLGGHKDFQIFLEPEAEKTPRHQALGQETGNPVAKRVIEIDKHVTTQNQVEFLEDAVTDEVMG